MSEQEQTKKSVQEENPRQKWHFLKDPKDDQNPEHWGMRCPLFHGHTDIYWAEDVQQFFVSICPPNGDYWRPVYFKTVFQCMNYVEQVSNEWNEYGDRRLDDPFEPDDEWG